MFGELACPTQAGRTKRLCVSLYTGLTKKSLRSRLQSGEAISTCHYSIVLRDCPPAKVRSASGRTAGRLRRPSTDGLLAMTVCLLFGQPLYEQQGDQKVGFLVTFASRTLENQLNKQVLLPDYVVQAGEFDFIEIE